MAMVSKILPRYLLYDPAFTIIALSPISTAEVRCRLGLRVVEAPRHHNPRHTLPHGRITDDAASQVKSQPRSWAP
jgi:hypothetical protein